MKYMMTMTKEHELLLAVRRAEKHGTKAQLANALDHLAEQYHRERRYLEAARAYGQAIGLWRVILGGEHPVVAIQLVNLAQVWIAITDLDRALPAMKEALRILAVEGSCEDEAVADTAEELAGALRKLRRHQEAKGLLQAAARVAIHAHVAVPALA